MASLTRCTWVSVNSGSWWWTGRPGMLWFMGSQRVRHDWTTELNTLTVSKFYLVLIDWRWEMFNWIPGGKSPWFAALDDICGNILPFPNGSVVSRRCRFDPWVGRILLKKEMASHLSVLAWEISWTKEPGGLQSMGLQKSQTWLRDSTTIAALDDFCRNILPLCPNLSYRCDVFEHGIGRKCTDHFH